MIVLLHHTADKYLERLNTTDRERINTALEKLGHEPPEGDIRPYEGRVGVLRLRVGSYRAIFKVVNDSILVTHIEPRGQAYTKKTKSKRGK